MTYTAESYVQDPRSGFKEPRSGILDQASWALDPRLWVQGVNKCHTQIHVTNIAGNDVGMSMKGLVWLAVGGAALRDIKTFRDTLNHFR